VLHKFCKIADKHKELRDFTQPKNTTNHIDLPPFTLSVVRLHSVTFKWFIKIRLSAWYVDHLHHKS